VTSTLVLGGARSGKSAYAERLAAQSGREAVYIATAGNGDGEMAARIALHRSQRPPHWHTIEEPIQLANAIAQSDSAGRVILVDCLTIWLSNLLFSDGRIYPEVGNVELPPVLLEQRTALLATIESCSADLIFVSNEVGMGIVPMGAISRAYVDEAGRLNQAVAAACDRAVFIAAGLPLVLKDGPCSPA
jgi:adenosylcobinamide kinase/adenosylcobinamide-phosphate guanylyltransferase